MSVYAEARVQGDWSTSHNLTEPIGSSAWGSPPIPPVERVDSDLLDRIDQLVVAVEVLTQLPDYVATDLTPVERFVASRLERVSARELGVEGVDWRTQASVIRLLKSVAQVETTYPSVVPDGEGGVVLHWLAAPQSLTVEVDAQGPTYVRAVGPQGRTERSSEPVAISAIVRRSLTAIADAVNAGNPAWRDAYLDS